MNLNDREQLMGINYDRGDWTKELLFYLSCMLAAIYSAALAVGVLSLNLRPVHEDDWRPRTCRSAVALVLLDFLTVDSLSFALRIMVTHQVMHIPLSKLLTGFLQDEVPSVPATTFIIFIGLALTISFNVMFVRMFGCCTCCRCGRHANAKLLAQARNFDVRK